MGLLSFWDSPLKIEVQKKGSIKEYIAAFPVKKGKSVDISLHIMNNVLKSSSAIILIDSSMCFDNQVNPSQLIKFIRDRLNMLFIPFEYRSTKRQGPVFDSIIKLLQFNKNSASQEILAFELGGQVLDDEILKIMLKLGCQIFIPFHKGTASSLIQKVFNGHYEDDEERYGTFEYVLYINSMISQAVFRTTALGQEQIEELCRY